MLSSDCIYIYIYWRGGNKLKAVLAMGFAGWKLEDLGRAESGWERKMCPNPPVWVKKEQEKVIPTYLCPEGIFGGAGGEFWGHKRGILGAPSSMRGWGWSRRDAGPGAPSEWQKPQGWSQRVTGAGSATSEMPSCIWDGVLFCFFPAVPSGRPQREAEACRPNMVGKGRAGRPC